jgi:hypothetical protein
MGLLGCHGGLDDGYGPAGDPNDHQLVLKIYGPSKMYVGSQSAVITAERSIESSQPINWVLSGPGRISNPAGSTAPPNQGAAQDYFPPPNLAGGTSASISFTTIDPVNGKSQTSPSLAIELLPVTTPMTLTVYASGTGDPVDQTIVAGNELRFTVEPKPTPAGFNGASNVQWSITSVTPQVPAPGTLTDSTVTPMFYSSRTFRAPAGPPSDYDVVIKATMHDPWFNIDPAVTMTVHVKKN